MSIAKAMSLIDPDEAERIARATAPPHWLRSARALPPICSRLES